MPAYIALLRGINVSGHKPVPMADLRKLFAKLGFADAQTYIQSGNVVFTSAGKDAAKIGKAIEAGIGKAFGFEVPVVVRSLAALRAALAANPYGKEKLAENERLYITFLAAAPGKAEAAKLEAIVDANDEVKVKGADVFLRIGAGYGKSVFSNTLVEKKLGVAATTRNIETSRKLVALAEGLAGGGV